MTVEITRENKIKQNLRFEMGDNSTEKNSFLNLIKEHLEKETKQKIEGKIDQIRMELNYCKDLSISITTVKEDKLKLIESKG